MLPGAGRLRLPAGGRGVKRLLLALAALLLVLPAALADAAEHTVAYYYRNYCESCDPEGDFAAEFRSLTGVKLEDCDFTAYNVARSDGQAALERALEEHGMARASLPMAIVDGIVYEGSGEMTSDLARASLAWRGTTDSEILFLYTPACERCVEAEAALDSLPQQVEVSRGQEKFTSRVTVRRVDLSAEPAFGEALFEAYSVPDEKRVTPIAFFSDRYLSGADAILARLADEVSLGWAVGGVPAVAAQGGAPGAGSLIQTVAAGLTAGLNTCALSMLLLFLSLILEADRRAKLAAAAFLAAKFACYLLIGFALLKLMQRLDPGWLRPAARWTMTVLGAMLIALNLSDALHARRMELGGIRNQLPRGLRGGLRRVIGRFARSRWLIAASAALGLIVASGEFLCAGQLYLMRLLSAVQSGERGQGVMLAVYCAAFLLPSAAVTAAVLAGGSRARAASFFADHMALIKLLTALVMALLILAAWLL